MPRAARTRCCRAGRARQIQEPRFRVCLPPVISWHAAEPCADEPGRAGAGQPSLENNAGVRPLSASLARAATAALARRARRESAARQAESRSPPNAARPRTADRSQNRRRSCPAAAGAGARNASRRTTATTMKLIARALDIQPTRCRQRHVANGYPRQALPAVAQRTAAAAAAGQPEHHHMKIARRPLVLALPGTACSGSASYLPRSERRRRKVPRRAGVTSARSPVASRPTRSRRRATGSRSAR